MQSISLHLLCPHNKIKFELSWLYKDSTSISCLRMFIAVFEILHRFHIDSKLQPIERYSLSKVIKGYEIFKQWNCIRGIYHSVFEFLQLGQDMFMWNKGLTRKYSTFWYYDSLLLFLLLYIPCFTRVVKQGNFPQFLSLIS